MTTDVDERQEVQTTSEAEPTQASEERELTAPDNEPVQPNSDSEREEQQGESTAPPVTRDQRLQALADAEREEAEQRGREAALRELQGNTQAQQKEAQKQRLRNSHTNTLALIDSVQAKAVDEYGSPRPLTAAEYGQIKAAQNEYHKVAFEVAEDTVADTVRDTAYAILPKAGQEQLTELTKTETDLPTYLNHWAEVAALHTKAVKSMGLEDAIKASPKVKREVEQAKLVSYDEGREQGRLDPPGTSPDGGRTTQRSAPGAKNFIELETKYADGTATKAETAEYLRLRDQRAKSR